MAPSTTSRLVGLIDRYQADHPEMRDAAIARQLGMSAANLSQWRSKGVRGWPARATLDALASTLGLPYREILDAALADTGYTAPAPSTPRTYDEVLADAIAALTEATRLANYAVRQTPSGSWEPDPTTPVPIDWAAFVTAVLAAAAANAGGIDAALAGRPGSWESDAIRQALTATIGSDEQELLQHRTEPVEIIVNPEQVLLDAGSRYFTQLDEAERELQRRSNAVRSGRTYSLGVEVIDGTPPPLTPPNTRELVEARVDAEDENPRALSAQEQADEGALEVIEDLRQRVEDLRRNELTDYGVRLVDGIRTRLAALALPTSVQVLVDDTIGRGSGVFGIEYPGDSMPGGLLEQMITAVVADTLRPDTLPGTLLTRVEHRSH